MTCTLTNKGKVAVEDPNNLIKESTMANNEYNFNAPVGSVGNQGSQTNIAGEVGGKQVIDDYSIIINENIDDINHLITSLREITRHFPDEQREDAEIEIDDLEEEIKSKEKQNPERIKRRLKRLASLGTSVAALSSFAVDVSDNLNTFTDHITELGEKLEIPIESMKAKFED